MPLELQGCAWDLCKLPAGHIGPHTRYYDRERGTKRVCQYCGGIAFGEQIHQCSDGGERMRAQSCKLYLENL